MKTTIDRLETALNNFAENGGADSTSGADLVAAAGEALGILRAYEGINVKQIMYDMARVTAGNGWVPDDFDDRAKELSE